MSSSTLFKLSGLSLLIALPLQLLGFVLHPPSERVADVLQPLYGPAHLILFASWMFALLGLTGFYAKQSHRAGVPGLIGFAATMFAAGYHLYLLLYEAYATVALAQNEATRALIGDGPLAHGAGALGPLALASILAFPLLGIATVRAGVLPRLAGWLQVASVPVFLAAAPVLPPPAPLPGISAVAFLYYLAFLGYAVGGYALWNGNERAERSDSRTSTPQPVA
ncbi:hypothetical protein [Rubrobacter indicoceani]|uniref:hypothetical protein n=1 Tax=Rubrobacter indicoceani TaxID=2051957 RepID=UPI000E5B8B7C|nr:hypothetical protein [Rubrobacter indicoceani]